MENFTITLWITNENTSALVDLDLSEIGKDWKIGDTVTINADIPQYATTGVVCGKTEETPTQGVHGQYKIEAAGLTTVESVIELEKNGAADGIGVLWSVNEGVGILEALNL